MVAPGPVLAHAKYVLGPANRRHEILVELVVCLELVDDVLSDLIVPLWVPKELICKAWWWRGANMPGFASNRQRALCQEGSRHFWRSDQDHVCGIFIPASARYMQLPSPSTTFSLISYRSSRAWRRVLALCDSSIEGGCLLTRGVSAPKRVCVCEDICSRMYCSTISSSVSAPWSSSSCPARQDQGISRGSLTCNG